MTLPEAIKDSLPPDNEVRIGTVLSRFPTTVDIDGEAVPIGALSSYLPIVGDVVFVIRQDSTWAIIGRTTSPDTGAFPSFQAGSVDITVVATTSGAATVVFATPFRLAPAVTTNINSSSGLTVGWIPNAHTITTTGFSIRITGPSASFTANVQWNAQEMTQ